MVGSGIGGLDTIYKNSSILDNQGIRKISPFFIPSALINLLSGHISIRYNLKGPNSSPVTACATGTHAIGDSFTLIKNGKADLDGLWWSRSCDMSNRHSRFFCSKSFM